ncbi:tRNA (adenosine(37)-N6)-dimethylallyltransferase MiaA [Candidatus Contendibacter odensensis]|uniref:tRNA dimethylallyltransferase n=1 Tax=Candidatus Contendobacter odensis Run_B_J11 TaxID=1400861 RepID=A0A7U7G9J3_9GAMM|nr:tRNA (adenosine(37)-N6)-dimethylallyltransferase MiaA [Candidatus Contendobacter odensis]MBK8750365.1 tRNA (adenosine(37)-N6)-dimethylallyltransferase MiaA [Candidatus Competibacteraceae bacterium]CDH43697.1 delta(2)-isopentenylpyrophosphate tRNA-adenosine transferase [Candidatus Contendobacter odensis Run_B_J11]
MTGADPRPPVLFLMGPTASGKTALAVDLVQRFPFEIISVDSALVYQGMDIGTAKPDEATRRIAPHRLLDILDPAQAYSAGQFRTDAQREIAAIQADGRVPLLVGGTMLYFRALERGLATLPSADPVLRARLAAEFVEQGSVALHLRLAQIDPMAAARIHPHDTQRIQRALEVHELTGRSLTELCAHPYNEPLPFRIVKLILAPDRPVLHERIKCRFLSMLEQGFITEVTRLKARGDLDLDKPAMRAVGYRQVWNYLDGVLDDVALIESGIAATRQFAKRQLTWLRAEPDAAWLDSNSSRLLEHAIAYLDTHRFFRNMPDGLC